jgi:two-component system, OmpR family, response regulator VicR
MDANPSRTILYIEDDPEMIDLVTLILSRRGYTVKGAQGGRQGLDVLTVETPDLILLDLMMPDMDGWDVFQQIRGTAATQKIPIVIITAKSQMIDKVLGLHIAGVDDYICKPFHPQELWDSLERIFARQNDPTPPIQ